MLSGVARFIQRAPMGLWVNWWSVSSFSGRIGVARFIRGAPMGRRVHWGSLGSFGGRKGVVKTIWGRSVDWEGT